MSQQYPPNPQPYGQQWGAPPPPPQPKKKKLGKILGGGCLGIVVLFVAIAALGSAGDSDDKPDAAPAAAKPGDGKQAEPAEKDDAKKGDAKKENAKKDDAGKVTFKVWGDAPDGALGPIDITYGSDSENLQGTGLPFTKTLPLDDDAMFYTVHAQLQGRGDIYCSVTVGSKTKKAHAQGGYNICNTQLSGDFLGGWD